MKTFKKQITEFSQKTGIALIDQTYMDGEGNLCPYVKMPSNKFNDNVNIAFSGIYDDHQFKVNLSGGQFDQVEIIKVITQIYEYTEYVQILNGYLSELKKRFNPNNTNNSPILYEKGSN